MATKMATLSLLVLSAVLALVHGDCGRVAVSQCLDSVNSTTLAFREIQHLVRGGKVGEDDGSSEEDDDNKDLEDVSYITIGIPSQLTESCRDFTVLDECIMGGMPSCEDITRSSYNGIHKSYTYLCSPDGKKVYGDHQECLLGEELRNSEHECEVQFKEELIEHLKTELTYSVHNYVQEDKEEICKRNKLLFALLACQEASVNTTCGEDARKFWHTFIYNKFTEFNLLAQCEEYFEDGGVDLEPGSYDVCEDGSDIYNPSAKCDGHKDCFDHSDEMNCTEAYTELTRTNLILLVTMGTSMLVLGVGTICVVKYRENRAFTAKLARRLRPNTTAAGHKRMDDMDEIMEDEEEIAA